MVISSVKLGQFAKPDTCDIWLGLVDSCIYYAHQTHEIYQVLPCKVDFKAPSKLWNPLTKEVTGKFHGSGGHSKYNRLQDRVKFHGSQACQIVLIFNTVNDQLQVLYMFQTGTWYITMSWSLNYLVHRKFGHKIYLHHDIADKLFIFF